MFEAVGYGSSTLGKVLALPLVARECSVQPASSEYANWIVYLTGILNVG